MIMKWIMLNLVIMIGQNGKEQIKNYNLSDFSVK